MPSDKDIKELLPMPPTEGPPLPRALNIKWPSFKAWREKSEKEIKRVSREDKLYKLQYLMDGEWRSWVPEPAPWEKKPFGEEIPAIVVSEGILVLRSRFPTRIIELSSK